MAENVKVNRTKKSFKRKRQLSKGESVDDDHTLSLPAVDKPAGKRGPKLGGTDSSFGCNGKKSKHASRPTCLASKKKPLGIGKAHKVVSEESNIAKGKKKKKKRKTPNTVDIQGIEKGLEACALLNDIHNDVTSKSSKKKALGSIGKVPKIPKQDSTAKMKKKKKEKMLNVVDVQDLEKGLEACAELNKVQMKVTSKASKKKPLGIRKVPKVVSEENNIAKVKKKKKKRKTPNTVDVQDIEKGLEACALLNDIHNDITSKSSKKKALGIGKVPKIPKQDSTAKMKKKKKGKTLNTVDIQDREKGLESFALLNEVHEDVTSETSKKKPLRVKVSKVGPKQDNTKMMKKKKKTLNTVDIQDREKRLESFALLNEVHEDVTSKTSKKKPLGVKVSKVGPKQDNTKMMKKKKKTLNTVDIQDLKKGLEACTMLNGVQNDVTSKSDGKKPKSIKDKPKKRNRHPDHDDVSGQLENVSCPVEDTDLARKKPSEKGRPLEHDSSVDMPTNQKKVSRKKRKRVKGKAAWKDEQNGNVTLNDKRGVMENQQFLNYPDVSQQNGNVRGNDKRSERFRLQEEAEALALIEKQQLVSYPEEIFSTGKDSYVVLLLPGQSLYLHGLILVRPLLGKVTILGYRMNDLEEQYVHSFNSHALLSVQAVEGCKLDVSQHCHLLDHGLSSEQLQDTAHKQVEPVVILELRKSVLPIVRQLSVLKHQHLMSSKAKEGQETLSGMLVTQGNCKKYNIVNEAAEWKELIENIRLYHECGNVPCVVVCGGKGVGKSTLFKYVVNGLLGQNCTKVQCLDIDPGQAELSMPACLSLTQVTEPLLGPSYTHLFDPFSEYVKQIMIGGVSPQFGLQRYVSAVNELVNLSGNLPDCPLVVNTMGWTVGTGKDLIFDTIRIVQPSHVIQIQGSNVKANFDVKLAAEVVQKSRGGVRTRPSNRELHYSLTELESLSGRKGNAGGFTPKLLRELAVMVQFSDMVVDMLENSSDQKGVERHTAIVQWPEVVLHVCGSRIPRNRILHVLNGNLVALCQVDPCKIESVSPDLPKHLINDLDFGQCLGWGIVRGIDPLTKSLHVITSLDLEVIQKEVNAVIMPELHLPDKMYGFFAGGM